MSHEILREEQGRKFVLYHGCDWKGLRTREIEEHLCAEWIWSIRRRDIGLCLGAAEITDANGKSGNRAE